MSYSIEKIRAALIRAANREWRQPVVDFQDGRDATPQRIQVYFESTGWGWFLDKYSDGTYTEKDGPDDPFQSYCGLFVAYCGLRVGDYLEGDECVDVSLRDPVASKVLPSTKRLARPRHWYEDCPAFEHPGLQQLKAGDVITVGDGRDGSHIAFVREDRQQGNSLVRTVEGNSTGMLGDGTNGEGVVHDARNFAEIKRTYRFTKEHFTGEVL